MIAGKESHKILLIYLVCLSQHFTETNPQQSLTQQHITSILVEAKHDIIRVLMTFYSE